MPAATSTQAREAILFELKAWAGLDDSAPNLAALRDRLSAPPRGLRIIENPSAPGGRYGAAECVYTASP